MGNSKSHRVLFCVSVSASVLNSFLELCFQDPVWVLFRNSIADPCFQTLLRKLVSILFWDIVPEPYWHSCFLGFWFSGNCFRDHVSGTVFLNSAKSGAFFWKECSGLFCGILSWYPVWVPAGNDIRTPTCPPTHTCHSAVSA